MRITGIIGASRPSRSRRSTIRALLTCCGLIAACANAFGKSCTPGEEEWVNACKISLTAQWDETSQDECDFNPDALGPGWVVVEAGTNEISSSNGSSSVSLLAAGANIATEHHFQAARENLIHMAGEYAGQNGQQRYSGQIDSKINAAIDSARSVSTNVNDVHGTASAEGSGNFFDRTRGWEIVQFTAKVRCIGVPDVDTLTEQFAAEIGIPELRLVTVKSNCFQRYNTHIIFNLEFEGKDRKQEGYVGGGVGVDEYWPIMVPHIGGVSPAQSYDRRIYVFAMTDDGTAVLHGDASNPLDKVDEVTEERYVPVDRVPRYEPYKMVQMTPEDAQVGLGVQQYSKVWRADLNCM
jgi:hypothetical protein